MSAPRVLGIDASNLRAGGGITHLQGILSAMELPQEGFTRVVVWGARASLEGLRPRAGVDLCPEAALERSLVHRTLWQRATLPRLAKAACDVLLCPGGTAPEGFHPRVVMCRNMLPFDRRELLRFGLSLTTLRLSVLRVLQSRAFERADGVIFLSEHAELAVRPQLGSLPARAAIIPHGLDEALRCPPRPQEAIESFSPARPFRWLYLSTLAPYKHPWVVAEAVASLRRQGLPVALDLVGAAESQASLRRVKNALAALDPGGEFLRHAGPIAHSEVPARLREANGFVFASSCENMPNILLEAMASGLPIACSDRGPMPEILGPAGVYFDPERAGSIALAMGRLTRDPVLRAGLAAEAYARVSGYSWARCAAETLAFVSKVAREVRDPTKPSECQPEQTPGAPT